MRLTSLVFIVLIMAWPSAGTTPAFAGKRIVPCYFPNGWNPTDFQRRAANIPPDIHHYCDVDGRGRVVDKAGRPTT